MKKKSLSQGQLSKKTGINRAYISQIINGFRIPNQHEIKALTRTLGITKEAIISPFKEGL